MSLTPTQLEELQTIVETLRTEFPSSDDDLWQAAIRIQKGGLGPVTGTGGQAAFDAAVADIVEESEQVSAYQGKQGGLGQSFDVAVFNVVPIEGELPAGSVGDVVYIDTAPSTYLATDVVSLTPAGPNSVIISEVGTQVARSVPAASGGMEVNNLNTGGGFERVLTTSDMGGATSPGGADGNVQFNDGGSFGGSANLNWDDNTFSITNTTSAAALLALNAGNNPSTVITIDSTLSTNYVAMRMNDQTGANFFQFRHDYSLSTPNHEFLLESSAFGDIIEIENEGNVYIGGNEASGLLKVLPAASPARVKIDGSASQRSLYFEEKAAASADVASEGQLWVRDDTPNVLVFTDDTGQDFVLSGGAVQAGTIDNQGLAWDVGNNRYEPTPEFAVYQAGLVNFSAVGKSINGAKFQILGTIANTADERGFFGFETSDLRMLVKNQNNSSDVAISARNGAGTDRILAIFNPTADTAIFGESTGVRISSRTSSPVRFLVNNADRVTVDDQGLNVIGNGVQAGVIDFTEGPTNFSSVAGIGQLWVRDDTPNVLVFTDDAGNDVVLGAGAPLGTDEQTLVYVGTTLTATDFFQHDNQNIITIEDQFAATHTWSYNVGGGSLLEFTSTAISDTRFPTGLSIAENSPGTGVFSFNYNGNLITMNASETPTTLRIGNSSTGIDVVEMFQGTRLRFLEVGGLNPIDVRNGGTRLLIDLSDAGVQGMRLDGAASIYLDEQAAAQADVAGYGQLWVTSASNPNELVFTDEGGNDINLVTDLWNNATLQAQTTALGLDVRDSLKVGSLGSTTGNIKLGEQANADVDETGYGQLWMETRPFAQRLMFTPENGADIIVAGLPDSDVSPGSNLISGTSFVAVANIGNVTDTVYMLLINVEVTAPAADDMLIQLTVNTGSRFKGVLTYAGQGITAGSSEIESTTGEVITNNVLVPTSGNSTPDGTYVSIQGVLYADSVAQTVSLRCAKNADTGADGFAIRAVIKALPCSNP